MKTRILAAIALSMIATSAHAAIFDEQIKTNEQFERLDKDRDDQITRDEFLAPFQHRFDAIDANGDGIISEDEFHHHLPRFDVNKDNVISHDEYMNRYVERFMKIDFDSNGSISREEMIRHWQLKNREYEKYEESLNRD